ANDAQRKELLSWFQQKDSPKAEEKIEAVKKIFADTGAQKAAHELMLSYYHRALDALSDTSMQEQFKNQFEELAGFLAERVS
ncbi:MAG: hypothetical protein ACPF8V_08455, partial [Luteibaculum sp.]